MLVHKPEQPFYFQASARDMMECLGSFTQYQIGILHGHGDTGHMQLPLNSHLSPPVEIENVSEIILRYSCFV